MNTNTLPPSQCQYGDLNSHNLEEGSKGDNPALKCRSCGITISYSSSNERFIPKNNEK